MKKVAVLAAVSLLCACAEPAANTNPNEPRAQREYPTGSNIPRKNRDGQEGVQTYDREAVERAQQGSYGGIPRVPAN